MQQRLKSAARTAGTWIVAAELLHQKLLRADDSITALHMGFGRVALASLTADFESNSPRGIRF
jgi:hypothetical protein